MKRLLPVFMILFGITSAQGMENNGQNNDNPIDYNEWIRDFSSRAQSITNQISDMISSLDHGGGMDPFPRETFSPREWLPKEVVDKHWAQLRTMLALEEMNRQRHMQQEKKQSSQENAQGECIICLCPQKNMLTIPCPNVHTEHVCVECYDKMIAINDKCPMCRAELKK